MSDSNYNTQSKTVATYNTQSETVAILLRNAENRFYAPRGAQDVHKDESRIVKPEYRRTHEFSFMSYQYPL